MLTDGQKEVREVIKSFLKEYENLQKREAEPKEFLILYIRVREAFCSSSL